MPRKVDHDERRHHVLESACRVIENEGVDAATVRRIAREAGCSTTIVSHYFTNKHQMLQLTYRRASEGAKSRVLDILAACPGDIELCLEALLPIDDGARRDWHIWFAFWGMAIGDEEFAHEHRRYLKDAVQILAGALRARFGNHPEEVFIAEAQRLFGLVSGLAVQAIFDRESLPIHRMKEVVASESARLTLIYGTPTPHTN